MTFRRVKRAQLLAIFDDEKQHKTLVRYYRKLGFAEMRDVGDDWRGLADRAVWGGVGALLCGYGAVDNSRPEASAARNLLAGLWLAGHTGLVLHILAFHIGTLMEVDLYEFLRKWGDTVRGMQPSVSAGRVTPPLATSDASTE